MIKTATVTWITYNNYGTALQAFSLQKYLQNLGFENHILSDADIIKRDVNNRKGHMSVVEHKKKYALETLHSCKFLWCHPLKFAKTFYMFVAEYIHFLKSLRKVQTLAKTQLKYEEFKNNELTILKNVKQNELTSLNNMFDVFISGSDQIWSVFEDNFNGYFYLDFVTKKKIAYACSIGTTKIDDKKKEFIRDWVSSFSAISVREKSTAEQLNNILQKNVSFVADPTFLNDVSFWNRFCDGVNVKPKKYILCYFLSINSWYFEYARELSKYLNTEIVLIPINDQYVSFDEFYNRPVGPKEFVALIKNAQFVLTDSYHGSIFSLIFNKNFLYLKRFDDNDPNNQNLRIFSLFDKLDINNILIQRKQFEPTDIQHLDYEFINNNIEVFRKDSQQFLSNNLSD